MRRSLTLALVFGLFSGTMSTALAHESHDWSKWARRTCRMAPYRADSHVRDLIRCAHRRVGQRVDIPTSLRIANHESGFEPKAYNPSSGAGGLYQWLASSWPGSRFGKMMRRFDLRNSRFNGRAAAFVSARVMSTKTGFSPWCNFTSYC